VGLLLAAFSWRRAVGALRDASAFAGAAMAIGAMATFPIEAPLGRVTLLAALGLALIGLHAARPSRAWLGMAGASFATAAVLCAAALLARPAYQFVPFETEPVGASLIVTAGLAVAARFWSTIR